MNDQTQLRFMIILGIIDEDQVIDELLKLYYQGGD